jgi:tetratricopeptide (TPR) repeat protein
MPSKTWLRLWISVAKPVPGLSWQRRSQDWVRLKGTCIAPTLHAQHYEEAVAIYRAEGDPLRLAHAVRHLGDIHRNEGRADLAEPCYHEALDLYRSHERTPPLELANAIRGLALLKEHTGEAEQARSLWEEARDLYQTVNVKEGVDESSRRLDLIANRKQA